MKRAFFALALGLVAILALEPIQSREAVTTVSAQFTATQPTALPSIHPPGGSVYCRTILYGPSAYAFLSPQQSTNTYTWQPLATQVGVSVTQGPGVYYSTLTQLYYRNIVSQVNFPGITGEETCSNAPPQPVYNGMDAVLDALTVTSLTATSVTTTNLTVGTLTGCLLGTAGVVSATPCPTAGPTFPPSPTPLPSPTSGNGNCSWSGLTITCTTPTPLPSPTAIATGCGTASWSGLAITVNTTGCQAQPPYNQKVTVELLPAGCAANTWCQCRTSPTSGESACTSDGTNSYFFLSGHFECFSILNPATTSATNFGLQVFTENINSVGSGNTFPMYNASGANIPGTPAPADVAFYITCLVDNPADTPDTLGVT